jgi:photoactive yellow protein
MDVIQVAGCAAETPATATLRCAALPRKVDPMNEVLTLAFGQSDVLNRLAAMEPAELDALDFGVIGFDAATEVHRYNSMESKLAGLSPARVLGQPLFTAVAPCMNNFLVAQRFEDAAAEGSALDVTIDYVFTLRMRPVKVKLRLLAAPGAALRYVLVHRPG